MKSEEKFTWREKKKGKASEKVLNSSMVLGMLVLLLLMVFMLLATPAAAKPVKVWVNAPTYVAEGGTFVATIDVDNLPNFNFGMFDFSFNSSVVVITDVEDGRLDGETIPVDLWMFMDENTIRVLVEIPGVTIVNGSGYLAKISFQAVGEEGDESIVNLSNGELICFNFTDSMITPEAIPAEWIDAEVKIVKGELEPMPTPPADRVHNLNTSENFSTIQAAIDDPDTKDEHTIEVEDGVYYENVKVTKSLMILSENGSSNCIVQAAKGNDNVFEITADHVCIRGFTVKDVFAGGKAGIYLNASHCSVSSNNCSDNQYGIRLVSSCNNTVSNNNCFSNNEDGISLSDSSNNTLSDNNCSANNWAGICLHNSSNNTIFDNNLTNNLAGIHLQSSSNNILADNRCSSNGKGISFRHSRSSILSNNNCSSNSDYGIHLYESSDNNVISDNTCSSNRNGIALSDSNNNNISANKCSLNDIGIHLWRSSNNNAISNNTCFSNTDIGIRIYESSNNCLTCNNCSNNGYGIYLLGINNRIYLNNFISSTNNVHSYPNNIWNSPQKMNYIYNGSSYINYMGNYWSDYNGSDVDSDGIGDTPYSIDSGKDKYPLMERFENYQLISIPEVHRVHNLNTGEDFLTIQDAIDIPDTKDGHIIEVDDGVYSENVEVTKSLSIRSEDGSANCIVQAENPNAHVFAITANNTDLSGFTVKGATNKTGIYLEASYCNVSNNNVTNNECGICLHYSCNNKLVNNLISENKYNFDVHGRSLFHYIQNIDTSNLVDGKPIYYCVNQQNRDVPNDAGFVGIVNSTNITVSNLTLTDNGAGVLFVYTNNSRIENVTTSNNNYGIYLWRSYNNTLTGNTMSGNAYNLCVFGDALCHYLQNIDMSNLVDEKTVYYWINQKDKQIPKDAGFVGIINSTNITVSDLTITNNIRGVLLAYTSNSRIERVNASNNNYGIFIVNSSNNMILNSTICENNRDGIYMDSSSNNVISNNRVCKNKGWRGIKLCDSSDLAGIKLCDSPDNMISNNTICENICDGIWLERSSNNTISNNRICKHRITGVFLEDASNNNTISHNTICENFNGIGVSWDEPSNNNVISHNRICKNDYGIRVCSGLGHMISNNEICENNGTGIMLAGSNSIIINNTVNANHEHGISLRHSNNNTLTNNIVNSNSRGIFMEWGPCNNNTLIDNTANRNREYGIYLDGSNKTLKGNKMANNKRNFAVEFTVFLPDNDIDKTNLVDGKPIYYIKYAYGIIIDAITNAGVVYCINCDNITVRDLTLANNSAGVCFYGTNNSRIENVKAMNNDYGIYLSDSNNNTLKDTIANSNCEDGFRLECSNNNTLRNNFASINDDGFCLFLSNDNILTDNTASNNHNGTKLIVSFNSLIYLNNFVYNARNFHSAGSNIWNSTSKMRYSYRDKTYTNYLGNYWSDYNGSDADEDGIGDTSYIIDSDKDNYPLMEPREKYF